MVISLIVFPMLITIICSTIVVLLCRDLLKNSENTMAIGYSLLACLVIGFIGSAIGYSVGMSKMNQKEFINSRIIRIEHQEEWTTHETRTETYTTGSGKNQRTHTRVIHYTQHHGPYFTAFSEDDRSISIGENSYSLWRNRWASERKTGEHRGSSAFFDRSITGGIFECTWPRTFDTIYPYSRISSYKNKIRASDQSLFKFKEPTKELLALYPRPADTGNMNPLISYAPGVSFSEQDQLMIMRLNAELGCSKQVHCLFVFFEASKHSQDVESDVLSAWQGVNKNELVTFIGVDSGKASWVKVESWMDNTIIHGMISDELLGKPLSVTLFKDSLEKLVPKYWQRKRFRDFDYLQIHLGKGCFIVAAIFWIISIAVPIWVVVMIKSNRSANPFDRYYGNRYRY